MSIDISLSLLAFVYAAARIILTFSTSVVAREIAEAFLICVVPGGLAVLGIVTLATFIVV